jgi:hypothetical protein
VEDASSLHLLGEGHKVGFLAVLQTPLLVSPELASRSNTGLDFINDKEDTVLLCDQTK